MAKGKHLPEEIAAKLQQADLMARRGALQTDIARSLGISVMTYHRWRKARRASSTNQPAEVVDPHAAESAEGATSARLREMQLENSRLRRLITDLLLEKMKLEEFLEQQNPTPGRSKLAG
jgi:transposase-like protein